MLAWRLMVEKMGKSKSVPEVEDWVVKSGGDDDGENRSKLTMVAVLEDEGCVDVAVVVSRYYGGKSERPATIKGIHADFYLRLIGLAQASCSVHDGFKSLLMLLGRLCGYLRLPSHGSNSWLD